jgi:Tfp pilus assembly protein PilO
MMLLHGDLKNRLVWCERAQWGLLAFLALFGAGAYLLWIHPANVQLESANARFVLARNELRDNENRAKNLPLVEMEIARLRQRVERFDKTLPRQQDLAQFMNDVTHISQDAALKKLSWHLNSRPKKSDEFTELPIQLTFEGDFQTGVVRFLQGTEDMQRLTRVRKLELKAGDANDGSVKAAVTMNLYFGEE